MAAAQRLLGFFVGADRDVSAGGRQPVGPAGYPAVPQDRAESRREPLDGRPPGSAIVIGMRILLASSEVHPYSKTGGLADMVGSLAKTLTRAGHRVGVITPL